MISISTALRHVTLSLGVAACAHSKTHESTNPNASAGRQAVSAGQAQGASGRAGSEAGAGGTQAKDASQAGTDSGTSSAELSAARITEIRRCMDERWGSSEWRALSDMLDDFEACAAEAENRGENFDAVVRGWAELDPNDRTRLRHAK